MSKREQDARAKKNAAAVEGWSDEQLRDFCQSLRDSSFISDWERLFIDNTLQRKRALSVGPKLRIGQLVRDYKDQLLG